MSSSEAAATLESILDVWDTQGLILRWHPLGFLDLPLQNVPLLERHRSTAQALHIWHPKFSRVQVPPQICHRHGWDMRSDVLLGQLTDTAYEVTPGQDASAMNKLGLYEIRYAGETSHAELVSDHITTRQLDVRTVFAGTTYMLPGDVFHWTTTPAEALTATFMTRVTDPSLSSQSVRPISQDSVLTYPRDACADNVVAMVKDDLRELLRNM